MKHIQWQRDSVLSSKTCRLKLSHHWLVQNVFAAARQCIVNRQSLRYRLWALEFVVGFIFSVWVSNILILWAHINIYILCLKMVRTTEMYPIHNDTTIFFLFKKKLNRGLVCGGLPQSLSESMDTDEDAQFQERKARKVCRNLKK